MQPAGEKLCYPDVCMDDLPARLASDLDGSFADFVRAHEDVVFAIALRVLGEHAGAEDVAQEACVRAYRALRRYPPERIEALRGRAWLGRIALNTARTHVRRAKQHDGLEEAANDLPEPDDGPLRLVERRAEREMWARLLRRLPERYRLPVALRHVDGLSYDELSTVLGRPVGTVKSDVHRGVTLLRAAYDAEQRSIEQKEAV